jgi:4-oxalocrotonate tautomerase
MLRRFRCAFVAEHRAQLLTKFRRVLMTVRLNCVLHGDVQYVILAPGNSDIAGFIGGKPTAIDDLTVCRHISPQLPDSLLPSAVHVQCGCEVQPCPFPSHPRPRTASPLEVNDMPLIQVKLIEGVFSNEQKQEMVRKLTDAMVSIEGENMRPVTWVLIEDVKSGEWGIGGNPMTTADVRNLAAGKKAA